MSGRRRLWRRVRRRQLRRRPRSLLLLAPALALLGQGPLPEMLEGRRGLRRRRGAFPEAVRLAAMEAPALTPCRALVLVAPVVPSE
eukprot:9100878-Alexandrium_andersonii.AAC.1